MTTTNQLPMDISLSDFGYDLPVEKIARYPLEKREASKLLVWRDGKMKESLYSEIAQFLPGPTLLVFNNSRVVEARILFQKSSGGYIEIFCLEPHESSNISQAMGQTGHVLWVCLIGGASKWKVGQILTKQSGAITLEARLVEKRKGDFIIAFSWSPSEIPFATILNKLGSIPLPPYLKRSADDTDIERYQTVYAKEPGSVAAPTAGLHFSENLLLSLASKSIEALYITLHVGAGTFMPVKTEKLADHQMHEEFIEVAADTLQALISKIHQTIIAVGTTSLRTLETLYWLGLMVHENKNITAAELQLDQNYPYKQTVLISPSEALYSLLEWIKKEPGGKLLTKTQLFIVPGYSFKMTQGLVTNFHQPHSTLLMLVAALIGPAWKDVYTWALDHDYRFLSYGDGCLFFPVETRR
jgi:S-adenosylmethionine:tRNA ribosyltransferase-isomerase